MTSYAEWFRSRKRAAKAREEEANPSLANRRAASRRKYHRRKERLTEQSDMQIAFLNALRVRAGSNVRASHHTMLPIGKVLTSELERVLHALDKAAAMEQSD